MGIIEFLVKSGASLNTKNRFGRTPLDSAIWWGQHDAAKFLVKHKAIPAKKESLPILKQEFDYVPPAFLQLDAKTDAIRIY